MLQNRLDDVGVVVGAELLGRDGELDRLEECVDVAPEPRPEEMYDTAEILCAVLLGVCVITDEVLGRTPVGVALRSMADEFDVLKAVHATERLSKAS